MDDKVVGAGEGAVKTGADNGPLALAGDGGGMNWNWWPPDPTRIRVGDLGTGEAGTTGGFQSSVWIEISLTSGLGGKTGVSTIMGEGGSYRSAPTPTLSYEAVGTWSFKWYEDIEGRRLIDVVDRSRIENWEAFTLSVSSSESE